MDARAREIEGKLGRRRVVVLYCHYFSPEQTSFQGDNINCFIVQECKECILVLYVISP